MDQSQSLSPSWALVIKELAKAEDLELHTSFPAKIKTYDAATQKASIVPLYKRRLFLFGSRPSVLTEENAEDVSIISEYPVIPGVPVHWPSANSRSTFIHLPLKPGDLGMAIVSERSLEKWLVSDGSEPLPNDDFRHHHLSDAWFVPGICTFNAPIENLSSDNVTIKNDTITIEITPEGKISFTNGTTELISVLSDLLATLKGATYITTGGPDGPWTTVRNTADIVNLGLQELNLNTFKV